MSRLTTVTSRLRKRLLDLRRLERVVENRRFAAALDRANPEQIRHFDEVISKSEDAEEWRRWVDTVLYEPIEYMSYRALRELAKNNNIPRYSRLSRDELLEALLATGMGKCRESFERNAS